MKEQGFVCPFGVGADRSTVLDVQVSHS